uniref:Uncharacterized protein n=1 Tax=Chrysotila carterae TaxID=13221 RepID=A0A7S4AY35_CHRCT
MPPASGVTLLGSPGGMADLWSQVPALAALVPSTLALPDLSPEQVAARVASLAKERASLELAPGVLEQLVATLQQRKEEVAAKNGALAEELLQASLGRYALRACAHGAARAAHATAGAPKLLTAADLLGT